MLDRLLEQPGRAVSSRREKKSLKNGREMIIRITPISIPPIPIQSGKVMPRIGLDEHVFGVAVVHGRIAGDAEQHQGTEQRRQAEQQEVAHALGQFVAVIRRCRRCR